MSRTRRRTAQPHTTPERPPVRSIITPLVDILCCGGLSILIIAPYLAYRLTLGVERRGEFDLGEITIVAALVNWPHFMASYRILYSSRLQILRHRWASLAVPALLLGIIVVALVTPSRRGEGQLFVNEPLGFSMMLVSHCYLAWHYTGQAWGMVAAFAYVGGIRMDAVERWLIRAGFRLLLVWHLVWASQDVGEYYSIGIPFETLFLVLAPIGAVTFGLGLLAFKRIWQRTGKAPPLRMMAPWAAAYLWYALLYLQPSAFFWVQISHALQYMIFPIRVELNQHPSSGAVAHSLRAVLYYFALVVLGLAVFYLPRHLWTHGDPQNNLAALISAAVNIHHYFVDGVIWKIRNPEVQRSLFSHLTAKEPATA